MSWSAPLRSSRMTLSLFTGSRDRREPGVDSESGDTGPLDVEGRREQNDERPGAPSGRRLECRLQTLWGVGLHRSELDLQQPSRVFKLVQMTSAERIPKDCDARN